MASIIDIVSNQACHCFDGLTGSEQAKEGKQAARIGKPQLNQKVTPREAPPQLISEAELDNEGEHETRALTRAGAPSSSQAAEQLDQNMLNLADIQRKLEALENENNKLKRENEELAENEGNSKHKRRTSKHSVGSEDDVERSNSDGSNQSDAITETESEAGDDEGFDPRKKSVHGHHAAEHKVFTNAKVLMHSAVAWKAPWQVLTYSLAAAGVIFVLIAPAFSWGQAEGHRRLLANSVVHVGSIGFGSSAGYGDHSLLADVVEDMAFSDAEYGDRTLLADVASWSLGSIPWRALSKVDTGRGQRRSLESVSSGTGSSSAPASTQSGPSTSSTTASAQSGSSASSAASGSSASSGSAGSSTSSTTASAQSGSSASSASASGQSGSSASSASASGQSGSSASSASASGQSGSSSSGSAGSSTSSASYAPAPAMRSGSGSSASSATASAQSGSSASSAAASAQSRSSASSGSEGQSGSHSSIAGAAHGSTDAGHGSGSGHGSSGGGGGGHKLIVHIAYSTVSAGLIGLLVHVFSQPLLLGYILGGVLVGPIGLGLIQSAVDINTISELGLILLLFMIGLELDVSELLRMGKVVIVTGMVQFPICSGIHMGIFMAFSAMGVSFGEGAFATQYVAVCCGISSTMIVVKMLSQKMETDTAAGRLTIGVLIFQDMWAIIVMAIQPNLDSPEVLGILKTFGMMFALLCIAFAYSKYVLPAVFTAASTSLELLLILSMAWCFFICCIAILPFFGLSMELAALIAGVAMATFPYSAELNGKLKYIRDYFITLYFVSLGMQIPSPTFDAIWKSLMVCVVVLVVRWLGLFVVVELLERDDRLAVISTMNLSEVSEFGLVLCAMGKKYGHVENDTFTIMIWTFSILAVSASYYIKYNHSAYVVIHRGLSKMRSKKDVDDSDAEEHDGHSRDIVLLGFGKIANALVGEVQERCPALLSRMHVIDASMKYKAKIEKKGVTFAYGDIGSEDVLVHCMPHGEQHIKLVLVTQPDSQLGRHTNSKLMNVIRGLASCAEAKVVCTAEHTADVHRLYSQGANYVLKMVKLSAERLADMLEQYAHGSGTGEFNKDMTHDDLHDVLVHAAQGDKTRERRVSEVIKDAQMTKKSMGQS